ncbi:MAG: hypothetical protein V1857_03090 [archaeon]
MNEIHRTIEYTYVLLSHTDEDTFLSLEDLELIGAYKRKYVPFSAFFATMMSYPVLRVADENDRTNATLALLAAILSIKVLDNINDDLHTIEEAVESLDFQGRAFLDEEFSYKTERNVIARAENWTYLMARWTYDILYSSADCRSHSFELYKKDMCKYIAGQKESFYQRLEPENQLLPRSLGDYLSSTCEKGIGNIWFDMAFCFYEKNNGLLDHRQSKVASGIKYAMALAYKSFLLYDDVSDLRDDLLHHIVNSAVLYAADHQLLSLDIAFENVDKTVLRLEKTGVLRDVMHLGDLIFLKAMQSLEAVRETYSGSMDIDAILFGLRVLRVFTMRKWILDEKSLDSFSALTRSFYSSDKIMDTIPARLLGYEKFLDSPDIIFH